MVFPQHVDLHSPLTASPLNRGRLAWWLALQETAHSTTFYDLLGQHNAAIYGAGSPWTVDADGCALISAAYANAGLSDWAATEGTIAAVFRLPGGTSWNVICAKDSWDAGIGFALDATGTTVNLRRPGGTVAAATAGVNAGELVHVVAGWRPGYSYVRVFGGLNVGTSTASPSSSTGVNLLLGIRHSNDGTGYYDRFDENIYEIAIWDRMLSAEEADALYADYLESYAETLRRPTAISVSEQSQFLLSTLSYFDAALWGRYAAHYGIDSDLEDTFYTNAKLDALLLQTQRLQVSTDAQLLQLIPKTHTTEAYLRRQWWPYKLDGLMVGEPMREADVDAHLWRTARKLYATDAAIGTYFTPHISVDSRLVAAPLRTVSLDTTLELPVSLRHTVSGDLEITPTRVWDVNAYLIAVPQKPYTVDAELLLRVRPQHTVDADLQKVVGLTSTADASLIRDWQAVKVDSLLELTASAQFTLDAQLYGKPTPQHLVDAVLEQTLTITASIDATLIRTQYAMLYIDGGLGDPSDFVTVELGPFEHPKFEWERE